MRRRLPQLALLVFLGYWTFLFILTHIPKTGLPHSIDGADKVFHFAAYAALAWLAAMVLRVWQVRLPAILLIVLLGGVGYGAVDEWLQSFVDNRSPDVLDWLADVLGVCAGLAAFVGTQPLLRRLYERWQSPRT